MSLFESVAELPLAVDAVAYSRRERVSRDASIHGVDELPSSPLEPPTTTVGFRWALNTT